MVILMDLVMAREMEKDLVMERGSGLVMDWEKDSGLVTDSGLVMDWEKDSGLVTDWEKDLVI